MSQSISVEQAAMSVKSVAAHALRKRLDAVWDEVPVAARSTHDEPQRIHRLRVATRRALAAIEVFHSVIPRKRARWFVRRLHELRRAAGKARDLDVLAHRFYETVPISTKQTAPLSGISAQTRARTRLLAMLACQRDEACRPISVVYEQLLNADWSRRVEQLLEELCNQQDSDCEESFGDYGRRHFKPMVESFFAITDRRLHGINQLHAFRIKVKQLRYTMEVFLSVFQPLERVRCCDALEKVQETLGTFTDNAAAADRLRRLENCSATDWDRSILENLLRETSQQTDVARREFVTWWSASRRRSLKRKLTRVLRTQSA